MGGGRAPSGLSSQVALGEYLSPAGLAQLKAYKYVSAPLVSFVDQKMTYWWEFVVNLMPMWLAPNLITVFSFMHAWIAHFLLTYFCPTLREQAPRWAYIVVALCMFLYQTLDAIDGKQARRTKNGSPLGQLFDHGCDAVTAWIIGIFVAATVQAGPGAMAYLFLQMVMVPFFAANWEESCTSVFRFGAVGVTEGQFLIMIMQILTGVLGPDMWNWRIGQDILGIDALPKQLTVYWVMFALASIGGIYQVTSSIFEVRKYYKAHPAESTRQAWISFVQFHAVVALGALWVAAPSGVMQAHPRALMGIIGALSSYQASRLIICHTTGETYPRAFAILWPLPLLVLNDWSGSLFGGQQWVATAPAIWAYGLYVAAMYAHFILVTIHQITSYLGIKCFKIKPIVQEAPKLADPLSEDNKQPRVINKVYGKAQ